MTVAELLSDFLMTFWMVPGVVVLLLFYSPLSSFTPSSVTNTRSSFSSLLLSLEPLSPVLPPLFPPALPPVLPPVLVSVLPPGVRTIAKINNK